jgi:hypothetical protein
LPSGEIAGAAAGSPIASVEIAAPVVPSRSVRSPVAVNEVTSRPLGSKSPLFHGDVSETVTDRESRSMIIPKIGVLAPVMPAATIRLPSRDTAMWQPMQPLPSAGSEMNGSMFARGMS